MLRYRWPRQPANVRAFLAGCTLRMANRPFSKPRRWLSLPMGTPFEIVAADIFRPLILTARGHTHILALIDHHTRRLELIALLEPTAAVVADAIFEQWISRCGTGRPFLRDKGCQLSTRLMQQLTDVYGIKHIYSSPYNQHGDSVAESWCGGCVP